VILDMENQLIQVKTQVAMAIADEHVLSRKQKENEENRAQWMRKAEVALDRKDELLARGALEKAESCKQVSQALAEQLSDQQAQTEALRTALRKLDQKLAEARSKCDLLIVQHRRSCAVQRAAEAGIVMNADSSAATFDRMRRKVQYGEALSAATVELAQETIDDRFATIERDERIDQLLAELKAKRATA
jgi:phage shock protein A